MADQWGTHTCRAPGCRVVIGKSKLMCPGHWARVPRMYRDALARVFRQWQRGADTFEGGRLIVRALREAQQHCIDSITEGDSHATPD